MNPQTGQDISLLAMTARLLRYKKIIAVVVLSVVVLTAAKVYLSPAIYRSRAVILPTGKADQLTQLKQLAGLGVTARDENSSELYPIILHSQTIRDAVLGQTYQFKKSGQAINMTLAEFIGETDPDIARVVLANMTAINVDRQGVIEVAVGTIHPELSQAVVREYLNQLENYNLHKRRSQARESEKYLRRQMETTRQELAEAEDRLEQFQLVNGDWAATTDPTTLKELARLRREAEVKSQALIFIMQQLEIARQEVQKDTPVVRILDEPTLPTVKSGPPRKIIVLVAGLTAFVACAFILLLAEVMEHRRRGLDRDSYRFLRQSFSDAFPRTDRIVSRIARFTKEKIPV